MNESSEPEPWTRTAWHLIEHVNAVSYFAPECREAPAALGVRGFWMGYFACRAAPLGAASPELVGATFYNFEPAMIAKSIPDAWSYASPAALLGARQSSAAAALRRVVPEIDEIAAQILDDLEPLVRDTPASGRPLFAANQTVARPDDPVERLWQAATAAREHRGDGHVAALVAADLDGCEALVLFAADDGTPDAERLRAARGWSQDEWVAAEERLHVRRLVGSDGALTASGRELRERIEHATDIAAGRLYATLHPSAHADLLALLRPVAHAIRVSNTLTYPNPMGLPPVE
ncbi:MAG: hypothetical protein JWM12_1408 [Ilumatobacteraceae bacterium]|nr:hypothetical protein [Ilumatobacteraceae bacterium]